MPAKHRITDLTQEELKRLLTYHKTTGKFYWKTHKSNCIAVGQEAGFINVYGYMSIQINGKRYLAHRLVWLYVYGIWPEDQLDHINGNRADNRIDNIRLADYALNGRNQSTPKNNTSGCVGVVFNRKQRVWVAQIGVNGTNKYLGSFTAFDEAVAARKAAEKQYGFHPNHGRRLDMK